VKLGRTKDETEVALKLVYLDAITCKEQEQLDREVRVMQTLQETDNPDARFVQLQQFHSRLSHAEEGGQARDVSLCTCCQIVCPFITLCAQVQRCSAALTNLTSPASYNTCSCGSARLAEQVAVLELELASSGELCDFIRYHEDGKWPEQVALFFFKQVSRPTIV
jgi:hypothetical protein